MKHSIIKAVALFLVLSLLGVGLIACGEEPKSAYDIAVDNGFVGTEEQWLASLQGQDLDIMDIYQAAVEAGAYTGDGDFLTFLTDYLKLDSDMIADAILDHQAKDTANIAALPLLSSVRIEVSSSGLAGRASASGSGVFLAVEKNTGDAYVLTNYHVIMQDNSSAANVHDNIQLFLYGDDKTAENLINAEYIGGSYTYDLAVLRVTGSARIRSSSAVPVKVANSDTVVAGADAIAIGNGAGLGISVNRGIVSIESKEVYVDTNSTSAQRLIQIDTPINEGNSGGGLFNSQGELIGIVNSKLEKENVENIGYAIPSNIAYRAAMRIITDFESSGSTLCSLILSPVTLRFMRLGISPLTENTHAVYDMERDVTYITETVIVGSVTANSAAKEMGLQTDDIIRNVQVDDTTVDIIREYSLRDAMLLCNVGSTLKITVLRGASEVTLSLTITAAYMNAVL